ncbi:hypothetical protein ACODG4_10995 [Vagococcus fluvialis]|uniref:hypothetical protein n=1 Tax=Vagococcus fluvialis TaxID=2738 RepID=UPI0032E3FB08
MKLSTAFSYRLKYQMKSISFFFGYFIFFSILFPLISILISGTDVTIRSDAMFTSFVFVFVIALFGVSTDFKLFIQNGMSRNNIFISYLISNTTISAFLAVFLIVFKLIANNLLVNYLKITLFLSDIYVGDNYWQSFLFLFLFFLFGASLSSLIGTFHDRVSGYKKIVTIATVIIVPLVLGIILQLGGPVLKSHFFNFLKTIIGITETGLTITPVYITLFVLIFIFSVVTYLMNYKREIRRVND